MEREYCPWCNTGIAFDPVVVQRWPLILFCSQCHGEVFVRQRIDYAIERGYKLPPEIVTHPPRI